MTPNDERTALAKLESGACSETVLKKTATYPSALLAAVAYDDFPNAVRLLLRHGACVKGRNAKGQTALHVAASRGCLPNVLRLLENNADPNAAGADGKTPLHVSVQLGHEAVARALLEHGANVDFVNPNSGVTPLDIAIARGVLIDELRLFRSEYEAEREFMSAWKRRLTLRRDKRIARVEKMARRAHGPPSSEQERWERVRRSKKVINREHDESMSEYRAYKEKANKRREAEREARECIVTDDDVED